MINNLQRFEFPEEGVDLESEIQSVPIRIFEHKGTEVIGVCLVEAAGVGQATIKLFFVDSAKRQYVKSIHRALAKLSNRFGFSEKLFQRKKQGKFITFFKSILPKIKRGQHG
jgi:hypothetical protein